MADNDLVTLQGEPGRWAEKVTELRERERQLAEREQHLVKAEQIMRVVANDLSDALHLIVDHQNVIERLFAPNPHVTPANTLLRKYQVTPGKMSAGFAVVLDGVDISDASLLGEGESIFDHFKDAMDADSTEISGELDPGERPALPPGEN